MMVRASLWWLVHHYGGKKHHYDGKKHHYDGKKHHYDGKKHHYDGKKHHYDGKKHHFDGQKHHLPNGMITTFQTFRANLGQMSRYFQLTSREMMLGPELML